MARKANPIIQPTCSHLSAVAPDPHGLCQEIISVRIWPRPFTSPRTEPLNRCCHFDKPNIRRNRSHIKINIRQIRSHFDYRHAEYGRVAKKMETEVSTRVQANL